jgi:hypothetical protein
MFLALPAAPLLPEKTMRVLLLPLLSLLLFATHPVQAEGSQTNPAQTSQKKLHPRVLNLNQLPVVINTPGTYFLNRSWRVRIPEDRFVAIIVRSPEVNIDLRGFTVETSGEGALIAVRSGSFDFTLRNGVLEGGENYWIDGSANRTTVRDLTVTAGTSGFNMQGRQALVKNLHVRNSSVWLGGADSLLDSSRISSGRFPAVLIRSNTRVTNSEIRSNQSRSLIVNGNSAVVANSVLINTESSNEPTLTVNGDDNVVLNNVFLTEVDGRAGVAAIVVEGSSNVLRDNLAPPIRGRWGTGISFQGSGNFYGNNQMAADQPFTGAGNQTDWGGNFGF